MRQVVEGMAACAEPKSGSVELAEACKRILPIAGNCRTRWDTLPVHPRYVVTRRSSVISPVFSFILLLFGCAALLTCCFLTGLSMAGPVVTNKWQEALHLNDALMGTLIPKVDPSTGKIASKEVGEFFNPKPLDAANKTTTALANLQEKAHVAEQAAYQMQQYAAECSKFVSDKITPVLKDWAKAKNAVYEMDAKITAEKEKVRKALETRIGDLTKDKLTLNQTLKKAEDRIRALEGTEHELGPCTFNLKKAQEEVQAKVEEVEGLEGCIKDLNDEIYQRKQRETELEGNVAQLVAKGVGLEKEKEVLNEVVAQGVADLRANRQVLKEVTEERDHFQVQSALNVVTYCNGFNGFVVTSPVQAQFQRMVAQEDSRLNKLVHVQMQCEPAVQDLAIQTEFVAPPVRTYFRAV
jgi:predicted  nucleic acid-binding Zn-ribbon protein